MMCCSGPSTDSKAALSMRSSVVGAAATTEAVRGSSESSAFSPKYPYCPSCATVFMAAPLPPRPELLLGVGLPPPPSWICTSHFPSWITYMQSPRSPWRMTAWPLEKCTSCATEARASSWLSVSDRSTSTRRSVCSRSFLEDCCVRMCLNTGRASAHSCPSPRATTEAPRGLEYISASSPKLGCVEPSESYVCTTGPRSPAASSAAPAAMRTSNRPWSIT
mmetsp:Transcript_12287/g.21895  ORF Transcript_12287/g.21895 Transcript_12287/m.21895 type:complete len:220 (-) Transcript_12287:312-971(-)